MPKLEPLRACVPFCEQVFVKGFEAVLRRGSRAAAAPRVRLPLRCTPEIVRSRGVWRCCRAPCLRWRPFNQVVATGLCAPATAAVCGARLIGYERRLFPGVAPGAAALLADRVIPQRSGMRQSFVCSVRVIRRMPGGA